MANVTRGSSAIAQHFCYATNDYDSTRNLVNPLSISAYVYNPFNEVVYTDNAPLPDTANFPSGGVFETHIPPNIFIQSTRPETYYGVVAVVQFTDGSIQTNTETVSVD